MATPTIYKTTTTSPSLSAPRGIAIDTKMERLIVCDSGNNRLVWCYVDGITQISTKSTYGDSDEFTFSSPSAATYYDGYYYVCDTGNHVVVRLRARDLQYKDHFGTVATSGSTNALLSSPEGITNDKRYIYVADTGNNRIMRLNLKELTFSKKSTALTLSNPKGIAYKKLGGEGLFISDTDNNRIIKTDIDFNSIENTSTGFTEPYHSVVANDILHLCNQQLGNDNIVMLAADGLALQTTQADTTVTLDSPYGIALYRNTVFISDGGNNRITVWKTYNPRDDFTSATPAKFGGEFFDNPLIVIDEDQLIVGATQESGSPNRWKEENRNNYGIGWVGETATTVTHGDWSEES